ncbi:TonB-dependent receptor [Marinilabiliaceae bacterium JC017]|nr:TonB-dependent receptor [Marinilabiliaceae bacterium JC017]
MKHLFLIYCLLAPTFLINAQILTVKDRVTHQPIVMANIYCSIQKLTTVTDAKGQADMSDFTNCTKIHISFVGYREEILSYQQLQDRKFLIYMEESAISLDELVISATRWQQKKKELPNKITSIPPQAITLQNPQTTADLLGQSGEVYIQKSQLGGGSPMIRGFATNRVLLAVDGVRMNNAIFRSGNLQNVISLDAFATERADVVFGPGSVIYGSDAIGGVMNFNTLTPILSSTDTTHVKSNTLFRYASAAHEKTYHLDVNIGLQKWAFVTSVTGSDYDDLLMGSHGPEEYLRPEYVERFNDEDVIMQNADPQRQVPTGYDQLNLMQKIRFKPTEAWDLSYDFHYSTTSDYGRYDRHLRTKKGLPRYGEWYYGPQEWMMNHLNILHHAGTRYYDEMSIHLAHQLFKESRHNRNFNAPDKTNQYEKVNASSLNVDFKKHWGTMHKLMYGIEMVLNQVNSSANETDITNGQKANAPSRYPDNSRWDSYAAYLTYFYRPTEKITLQSGMRYNQVVLDADFDNTFYPFPFSNAHINNGALTGSLGCVYNPSPSWQLYTNLSTGFRAPNIDDVGKIFDSEPGAVVVPNPDLKPEYSYNAEIGLTKVISKVAKIDMAAYYTYLDDAMVRRDFLFNGNDSIMYDGETSRVQAIQNAASAYVYGFQAGIEIKLPDNFELTSRFNYQKGEEELDNGDTAPMRHAAPWFGITHLTYSIHRLKADLYAVYNGEVSNENLAPSEQKKDYMYALDANKKPYSPAWHTFNIKAMYQVRDYLMISAGIENLADKRYCPYSSGIVAPGRNYIVSLKASF